jgi:hypothetical protein
VKYTLQWMHGLLKEVTKKRLELKTSYLIKQLLTKQDNAKHIVLFRRRIVVVERAHKKLFLKKKKISLLDDNKG